MDSGLGNSSVEDVATVEGAAAAIPVDPEHPDEADQQQEHQRLSAEGGDCVRCGETRALDVGLVEQLNLLLEGRLRIAEEHGNESDFKIKLYEDWVKQLRLFNLDLVATINELQETCKDRIVLMRAMYKKNLARLGPQALQRIENDRDSLVEVIRRASTTGRWDMSGIKLNDISLDQLFGEKAVTGDSVPNDGAATNGPTISVNLEVSSNCQLENPQIEDLQKQLEAKERQIKYLEKILQQQIPNISRDSDETDLDFRSGSMDPPLLQELKQTIEQKNQELRNQSSQIHDLREENKSLRSKIEEMDLSSQFDSDMSVSMIEFKAEDTDTMNSKLMQLLQNQSRLKSEQLETLARQNEELRKEIGDLKGKFKQQSNRDNESLINEIKDHYDRNCQLQKKLNDAERLLREANSAVTHRKKVIHALRQDNVELKKSLTIPSNPALPRSVSNPNMDSVSICSSESSTSFGSANSDSSSSTVLLPSSYFESKDMDQMVKGLQAEFQETKQAQEDIIAEQRARLEASDAELKVLRKDYENNERKLFHIRTEMRRLLAEVNEHFKNQITLPRSIEEFLSQPDVQDVKHVIDLLKQYLDLIMKRHIAVTKDRQELCQAVDDAKRKFIDLQHEKEQCEYRNEILMCEISAINNQASIDTDEKETSIDSDILSVDNDIIQANETLTAQRIRMRTVLRDISAEIASLIGKNLSNDSISSLSELDATPLHFLITDLKKEIESKDKVLSEDKRYISRLEQDVRSHLKDLHRLKLCQETMDSDRMSYEKSITNLQRALHDHDETISALKQHNVELQHHMEDLEDTLQKYKESIRRLGDEKASLEEELEGQKQRHLTQIKNEMNNMQSQMAELKKEIDSRQRDCSYYTFFRHKCAELEMEHQQELQRMRSDIEALSAQLMDDKEASIQHDQLVRESNNLQNTILELSNQNEMLQKEVQSYQNEVENLQQEYSTSKFQFTNLNQELENLKALCSEKDSKIISLNSERDKLQGDLNLHKRMCKCGFNTNVKERSKTPVSHSLQKQVVQKTLEATKASDALKQRTADFKRLENQYVEERIRLTQQTTELFTQIGKLTGRNSNLEQSLSYKEEQIERLQQNVQEIRSRLTAKSEIAQTMEAKNASLSQAWEKYREDATAREKKLIDELNSIKRDSLNQQTQLQQCEHQLAWHREELDKLRDKADSLLKERDTLRQQTEEMSNKLSCSAGEKSASCEVIKQLLEEVSFKKGRLAEIEDNYRKLSHAYQNMKTYNEDLTKQYQTARNHLENYKELVEFKRQTINTLKLARKCAEESRQRERDYEQKVADQKRIIAQLKEDRVKLMEKMQEYHRDSLILNRRLEDYQHTYEDNRRNLSTSLHQTFYPSEVNKLVRSSSDPNCKESDELLRRLQYTKDRIHRTREFWYRGIKEILPPRDES
ncbi:myosin-9-like isoform X4 [Armigeres subalbatus]|uniref:myosin-9-like isoform X4 n=1 Tax=Armigeres subalbatus TaxID=124917 RepID=UPI002ECFB779